MNTNDPKPGTKHSEERSAPGLDKQQQIRRIAVSANERENTHTQKTKKKDSAFRVDGSTTCQDVSGFTRWEDLPLACFLGLPAGPCAGTRRGILEAHRRHVERVGIHEIGPRLCVQPFPGAVAHRVCPRTKKVALRDVARRCEGLLEPKATCVCSSDYTPCSVETYKTEKGETVHFYVACCK